MGLLSGMGKPQQYDEKYQDESEEELITLNAKASMSIFEMIKSWIVTIRLYFFGAAQLKKKEATFSDPYADDSDEEVYHYIE